MTTQTTPTRTRALALSWSTAWKRVLSDARNDLIPDPLDYADYKRNAAPHIERARRMFRQGYTPHDVFEIDVPKRGFTLRPGTTLLIEDRLVYQALIDKFALRVDRRLEDDTVVYGYRVRSRGSNMFRHGVSMWLKKQDMIRDGYRRDGYRYLLNTDVVAYFEHINHRILDEQLASHGVHAEVRRGLSRLLSHWSNNRGSGIPQGHNPSSLLGNIYLDPVDKAMIRAGYRYFRWNDDIYVFARSKADLRRALKLLNAELRKLRLYIQEAKTDINEGTRILDLVDKRRDQLAALDYAVDADERVIAFDEIKAILRDMRSTKAFNESHFVKCLNELRKLESDLAVDRALRRLEVLAHRSDDLVRYLALFINRKRVQRALMDFLQDCDKNMYSWQELWFLWALRQARGVPREFLNFCRDRTLNAEHWACRSNYALLLGKFGDAADIDMIADHISDRSNLLEARAFVAAIEKMELSRRNNLLQRLKGAHPELAEVADYVRSS